MRNLNTLRCGFWILWNYKVRFNADNYMEIHDMTAKDIYESKPHVMQHVSTTTGCTSSLAKVWLPQTMCYLLHSSSG